MREEIKKETTAGKKGKVESTIVKGMMWQRLNKTQRENGWMGREARMYYTGPKQNLEVKRRQWGSEYKTRAQKCPTVKAKKQKMKKQCSCVVRENSTSEFLQSSC